MNYVIQCISCKQVSDIFIMPKLNLDSEQNRKFEKILKLKSRTGFESVRQSPKGLQKWFMCRFDFDQ